MRYIRQQNPRLDQQEVKDIAHWILVYSKEEGDKSDDFIML